MGGGGGAGGAGDEGEDTGLVVAPAAADCGRLVGRMPPKSCLAIFSLCARPESSSSSLLSSPEFS